MKVWLANMFWDALAMFAWRVHDWAFDPQRHAKIRYQNRLRWWAYHQKAQQTKGTRDDLRAQAWQTQFAFKTPPDEALERGDLTYPCH